MSWNLTEKEQIQQIERAVASLTEQAEANAKGIAMALGCILDGLADEQVISLKARNSIIEQMGRCCSELHSCSPKAAKALREALPRVRHPVISSTPANREKKPVLRVQSDQPGSDQ